MKLLNFSELSTGFFYGGRNARLRIRQVAVMPAAVQDSDEDDCDLCVLGFKTSLLSNVLEYYNWHSQRICRQYHVKR